MRVSGWVPVDAAPWQFLLEAGRLATALFVLFSVRLYLGKRLTLVLGLLGILGLTMVLGGTMIADYPAAKVVRNLVIALPYFMSAYNLLWPKPALNAQKLLGGAVIIFAVREALLLAASPFDFAGGIAVDLLTLSQVALIFEAMQREIRRNLEHAVLTLAAAVEARDIYTINHSHQVATLGAAIAKQLGFSRDQVEQIHFAGLLHDIGKIGVPDYILQKPGKLSAGEFDEVKRHPEIGFSILQAASETFEPIASLVRFHHERWDGNGYPLKLKGAKIPVGAAILAVADTFDAMVSNRSYRDARIELTALKEIEAGIGTQFSPVVARAFVENYEQIRKWQEQRMVPAAADEIAVHQESRDVFNQVKVLRPFDYRVRYKGILNSMNDAVLVFSEHWRVIDWNRKAEEKYGYTAFELQGRQVYDFCTPGCVADLNKHLQVIEERGALVFETEHRIKDQTAFPVEISIQQFIQTGERCWMAVIRDISERKCWERDLEQRERRYRLLFEGVSDAVLVFNMNLEIIEVNEAACRRLGYSREELMSKNVADIDTPVSLALVEKRLEAIQEKGELIFEVEHFTKSGKLIPVEISASVTDIEGQQVILTVQRDLRERKVLERMAVRMLDSLPHAAYLVTAQRQVLAANKVALKFGAVPERKCYESIFAREEICPYCLADEALGQMEARKEEVAHITGKIIAYWIPLEEGLYLHYFVELDDEVGQ